MMPTSTSARRQSLHSWPSPRIAQHKQCPASQFFVGSVPCTNSNIPDPHPEDSTATAGAGGRTGTALSRQRMIRSTSPRTFLRPPPSVRHPAFGNPLRGTVMAWRSAKHSPFSVRASTGGVHTARGQLSAVSKPASSKSATANTRPTLKLFAVHVLHRPLEAVRRRRLHYRLEVVALV
jgi:hypothetical protein